MSRWSPFAFGTLKEIPFPSWAIPFTILFFCLIWRGYEKHVDHSVGIMRSSHIPFLLQTEKAKIPRNAQVLFGGSSVSKGFNPYYMDTLLNMPTSTVWHNGGSPWEFHKILKKYPKECQHVRVVVHDLDMWMLRNTRLGSPLILPGNGHVHSLYTWKGGFLLLKEITDWLPPNDTLKISRIEAILPYRCSIRNISKHIQDSKTAGKQFLTYQNFGNNYKKAIDSLGPPKPTGNRAGIPLRLDNRDLCVVNKNEFHYDIAKYYPYYQKAFSKIFNDKNGYNPATYRDIFIEAEKLATQNKVPLNNQEGQITNVLPFEEQARKNILEFVEYCRKQGIFVVFHIPPKWKPYLGRCPGHLPTWDTAQDIGEFKFLIFVDELNSLSNCTVVNLDAFQSLYPEKPTELFMRDSHHIASFHGPAVYMNWIADQMLNDPKIAAALKTSRKPEEFFVKKYVKKGYKKVASYFKKKKENDVKIAQPQRNPVK
jgi:hypothetical protein